MAEMLMTAEPDGPTDLSRACRQIAAGRRGAGVMIVLSDFLIKGGYDEGLRRLISRQYDLYVLQVLSPGEIDPPLTGDLRLEDVEDGDVAEITVTAGLIRQYKRNLAAWCGELETFCRRRGVACARIRSDDDTQELMLNYLRQRGLLR
jgi:hypothetical protein